MIFNTKHPLIALAITLGTILPALGAPILRPEIAVSSAIVTVGDMFSNAGLKAEQALFRAPAPGTAGAVSITAIRLAAKRVGIVEFDDSAISRVRVERKGTLISEPMLKSFITDDLRRRGIVTGDVIAQITFSQAMSSVHAEMSAEPLRLNDLRYTPSAGSFTAKFTIAGVNEPLDLSGRLDLMIEAPHLVKSLPKGAIIGVNDVEMRPVMLRFADAGIATFSQIIGQELRRSSRDGMMIRPTDVTEPELIKRSELVTLYYQNGALRLTIKGQALNAAAQGETVSVLNLLSKKIVHGIAINPGTVEMVLDPARLAEIQS